MSDAIRSATIDQSRFIGLRCPSPDCRHGETVHGAYGCTVPECPCLRVPPFPDYRIRHRQNKRHCNHARADEAAGIHDHCIENPNDLGVMVCPCCGSAWEATYVD